MKTYCPVRPANRAVSGDLLGSEGDEAGDDVKTPVDEARTEVVSRTSAVSSSTPSGIARRTVLPG
jgi:hypothetical protein